MERVLITGANRGIGFELVRQLLGRGDRLFAGVRDPAQKAAFHRLPEPQRARLSILPLDVSDTASIAACAERVAQLTDGLDVLINNAGINYNSPEAGGTGSHTSLEELTPEHMLTLFRVNTIGPMMIAKAFLPLLESGRQSRIINISSKMGSIAEKAGGDPEYTYSASKAALNMLTRVLALEAHALGITVVAVNPGWVATAMGGRSAPLQPADSAAGIIRVLDQLDIEESGRFLDWAGNEVSW